MSRPPPAPTATTSAAVLPKDSTTPLLSPPNDGAHDDDVHASLAHALSSRSSSASSPATTPRVKRVCPDVSFASLPSVEQNGRDISTLVTAERVQLFNEAPASEPAPVDAAHHYDPLLAQRMLHYKTTELPLLLSSNAHRSRDLAALAIESRNPLSRLNALPTLGPLQMIEQYVRRSMFRAGVVSSEPGRRLRSSHVARELYDTPYYVGELSNGTLAACTLTGGSCFLQVFDSSLNLQRSVSSPFSVDRDVFDMVVTQQDTVAFVAEGVAHLMRIDGALLAPFSGKHEDDFARSVTQLADGAFAVLLSGSRCVQLYSASSELQHSFMLDDSSVSGAAFFVRATSDDHIVVARHRGVQWYWRDGTLLRHFVWPSVLRTNVAVHGVAVDAESNVVVSDCTHNSVLIFRADGTFMRSVTAKAFEPCGVSVTAGGHIVVCNSCRGGECLQLWS